jgi:hypothetical protein
MRSYEQQQFCETLARLEKKLGDTAAAARLLQRSVRIHDSEPTSAQLEDATALVAALDELINTADPPLREVLDEFATVVDVLAGRTILVGGNYIDVKDLEARLAECG